MVIVHVVSLDLRRAHRHGAVGGTRRRAGGLGRGLLSLDAIDPRPASVAWRPWLTLVAYSQGHSRAPRPCSTCIVDSMMLATRLPADQPSVTWRAVWLRGPLHDLAMAMLWVPFA